MHLHILGLSGTFMSALAILARVAGFKVTGSDAQCYPPISDLLKARGISWTEGYEDCTDALKADCVIVGNALKRGMPVIEKILDQNKPYTSGPEWLAKNLLAKRRVLAVAGTHGKTTTTSMLALILDYANLKPGFLIGGVSSNFGTSARLGEGPWFVIEADEYDSAFFDKRPKFMHYRPEIAILNNLEFDHADIYPSLEAIQQQFHYLLRTIPPSGLIIKPRDDVALNQVLLKGRYSHLEEIACSGDATWCAQLLDDSGQAFQVRHQGQLVAEVRWSLIGRFNVENGLAAIAASARAGVNPAISAEALAQFMPVKRRLEVTSERYGITVYDDFAHHPTAIRKTIDALKQRGRHQRVIVILEFASYTMRTGVHKEAMASALESASLVYLLNKCDFSLVDIEKNCKAPVHILSSVAEIIDAVLSKVQSGDAVLVMSNRGFENIHLRLAEGIDLQYSKVKGAG
ncbi:MAG: UDP-N-acetylmuramate:L-alanyl-gamma-D-glutamyl-meso-diaminopimelate ligase [Legionellales bacterium]|nr:UDP-N-acetylmuramate:L-alanyl-gamma-D-glutamyl-meso-diaminopimelate ligase [Legionellales bacterium]